jgi:hypothetical protein
MQAEAKLASGRSPFISLEQINRERAKNAETLASTENNPSKTGIASAASSDAKPPTPMSMSLFTMAREWSAQNEKTSGTAPDDVDVKR